MKLKLVCENRQCPFKGSDPYSMDFPDEAILDARNVAAVYCPHCNHQMQDVNSSWDPAEKPAA